MLKITRGIFLLRSRTEFYECLIRGELWKRNARVQKLGFFEKPNYSANIEKVKNPNRDFAVGKNPFSIQDEKTVLGKYRWRT